MFCARVGSIGEHVPEGAVQRKHTSERRSGRSATITARDEISPFKAIANTNTAGAADDADPEIGGLPNTPLDRVSPRLLLHDVYSLLPSAAPPREAET